MAKSEDKADFIASGQTFFRSDEAEARLFMPEGKNSGHMIILAPGGKHRPFHPEDGRLTPLIEHLVNQGHRVVVMDIYGVSGSQSGLTHALEISDFIKPFSDIMAAIEEQRHACNREFMHINQRQIIGLSIGALIAQGWLQQEAETRNPRTHIIGPHERLSFIGMSPYFGHARQFARAVNGPKWLDAVTPRIIDKVANDLITRDLSVTNIHPWQHKDPNPVKATVGFSKHIPFAGAAEVRRMIADGSGNIGIPSKLIIAGDDTLASVSDAKRMARLLGAKYEILNGQKHEDPFFDPANYVVLDGMIAHNFERAEARSEDFRRHVVRGGNIDSFANIEVGKLQENPLGFIPSMPKFIRIL